jgi:predicted PurR-regulated permease PerM
MAAAADVAVTHGVVRVLGSMSSILVLIGVAFFLALGLEPAASWFVNRKLPRWAAITLVFVIFLALLGAFVGAAIPTGPEFNPTPTDSAIPNSSRTASEISTAALNARSAWSTLRRGAPKTAKSPSPAYLSTCPPCR